MSDSPIPISRQDEAEIINESPDIQTLTSIDETSILEKADLPILLKSGELTSSHVDENNENEAVRKTCLEKKTTFLLTA
jgi:hypothetical protein